MELRQLRYFVAVAEDLHFGRAAERLLIAQSAVSQQVRRLERELGLELLDRSPRRVRLTEAGERFLPAAREVLDAEQRALAAVEQFTADRGALLRIGTSTGMGERLDEVLEALQRLAPHIKVELASEPVDQRLRRVADREWDAAFLRGEVDAPEQLRQVPVWRDDLVAALPARHRLAAESGLRLGQLAELPLLLTTRRNNPPLVDLVLGACRDAGFEPVPGPGHGSLQDTLATLGTGRDAWTVIYASHAAQLRSGRVAFVPVCDANGEPLALPTVLAVHRSTPAARLRPLLDACRAVARSDLNS
jgi:DNA-binding transcriptional LysR family regulator